jgi:hypothetical protein
VWNSFGYDKVFNTPEDFFLDVIDDMKVKEQTDSVIWEKNGEIFFEQDLEIMYLRVNYDTIWKIFDKVFSIEYIDIQQFIKDMVEEHLNWKGFTPTDLFTS